MKLSRPSAVRSSFKPARLVVAAALLAVLSTGCLGLDLALCCLNCGLSVVGLSEDRPLDRLNEHHPEFMAKMKEMQKADAPVRY